MKVVVIKNGGGNAGSVRFALDRLGARSVFTDELEEIQTATHVILPGVGAFDAAMERMSAKHLVEAIRKLTVPVLGICLGMQMLHEYSEEGVLPGLGILPGGARRFSNSTDRPVPHMGWNRVAFDPNCKLKVEPSWFYFVHSFAVPINDATVGCSGYGDDFSAAVRSGNFYGVQFHPERSGAAGEALLGKFLSLNSLSQE